eukprot:727225-Pelagomonas_calceolata.AAC.6
MQTVYSHGNYLCGVAKVIVSAVKVCSSTVEDCTYAYTGWYGYRATAELVCKCMVGGVQCEKSVYETPAC